MAFGAQETGEQKKSESLTSRAGRMRTAPLE